MGSSEEGKPCKPEKPSSLTMDQNGVHVYPPDWAMMQAYYGPRFAVPPYLNPGVPPQTPPPYLSSGVPPQTPLPYLNSGVAPPQTPPPYMWLPPQSMIHPYGVPYAAFYHHGGMYGHPGVAMAGTAFSPDTSVKSSGNTGGGLEKKLKQGDAGLEKTLKQGDAGLEKKLKQGDALAISIGDGNANNGEHGTDNRLLGRSSGDSSGGSNGSSVEAGQRGMKRSRPGSPNITGDVKARKKGSSKNMIEMSHPANIPTKTEEDIDAVLELKEPSVLNVKPIPNVQGEAWLQNERELKQERRKQSNRDSARRSRLRKQAEVEQLTIKVQSLTTEKLSLKSKINDIKEICEKLMLENAKLKDKLEDAQTKKVNFHKIDDLMLKPVCTANLLARVEDKDPNNRSNEEGNSYENREPVSKLHQLLDAINAGRRADAVAAS